MADVPRNEDEQLLRGLAKYTELLKPIKSLSENWGVDLGGYLTDYVEELTRTMENSGLVNFPQAALFVQGATCVYLRKVDYLHQMVQSTLQNLAKNKQKRPNGEQAAGDDDNGLENQGDSNSSGGLAAGGKRRRAGGGDSVTADEFADLSNIKASSAIDLKPESIEQWLLECAKSNPTLLAPMPMALTPLEDYEKTNVPLISRNGETIGKKDDYKLNTCYVHSTGTLLLDLENAKLIPKGEMPFLNDNFDDTLTSGAETHPKNEEKMANQENNNGDASMDDNGAFDDRDDAIPSTHEIDQARQSEGVTVLGPNGQAGRGSVTILRVGDHAMRQPRLTRLTDAIPERRSVEEALDPFALPDPYQVDASKVKKERKGRTCRKIKLDAAAPLKNPTSLTQFINNNFYSCRHKFPKNPLKAPSWKALDDQFWIEHKRRQDVRRRAQKQRLRGGMDANEYERQNENEVDPEDDDGAFGDQDDDRLEPELAGLGDDEDDVMLLDAADLAPHHVATTAGAAATSAGTSRLDHMTYEETVQYHIDKIISSAHRHVMTNELTKRVQQWEDRVLPRLHDEEQRRPFDVHEYGSEILNKFNGDGDRKQFAEVVCEQPTWEVSRYFLASLMMANTYNVRPDRQPTFDLTLLKRERHHECFAEKQL